MFRLLCFFYLSIIAVSAQAETAAEKNKEAVFISSNFGIPQLNGRLLLPAKLDDSKIDSKVKPIRTGWRKYVNSFGRDTSDPIDMIIYAVKTQGRLEQILRSNTTLSEAHIQKIVKKHKSFAYTFGMGQGMLTQFEERAVLAELANIYNKEKHRPAKNEVPVNILLSGKLSHYDFDHKRATVVINKINTVQDMPREWWRTKRNSEKLPLGSVVYLEMPQDHASIVFANAKSNPYGRNVVYIGTETYFPTVRKADNVRAKPIEIERILYSFSPDLKEPFFIYDASEKRRKALAETTAQKQLEQETRLEEQRALENSRKEQTQRETEGFNRESNIALFETLKLQIGTPPPEGLAFSRYSVTQRGTAIPALSAFFHANTDDGEVAFYTTDGQVKSPIVYYARYFGNKNLTGDALKKIALTKLGQPLWSGYKKDYWWDKGVPQDRSSGCRVDILDIGLGNASLMNGEWTRYPLWLDIDDFSENCGIIAAIGYFGSKRYAVADTTYFNTALANTRAAEQHKVKDLQTEAAEKIDF